MTNLLSTEPSAVRKWRDFIQEAANLCGWTNEVSLDILRKLVHPFFLPKLPSGLTFPQTIQVIIRETLGGLRFEENKEKFKMFHQYRNENIESYAFRLSDLIYELNSFLPLTQQIPIWMINNTFIEVLNHIDRNFLIQQGIDNIDVAVDAIKRKDLMRSRFSRPQKNSRNFPTQPRDSFRPLQRNNDNYCSYHRKTGHDTSECLEYKSQYVKNRDNIPFCRWHNIYGHSTDECKSKENYRKKETDRKNLSNSYNKNQYNSSTDNQRRGYNRDNNNVNNKYRKSSSYFVQERNPNLKKIKLDGKLNEIPTKLLMDTGSQHTIISRSLLINRKIQTIPLKKPISIVTANNSETLITERANVLIDLDKIPSCSFKASALVIPKGPNYLILGMDFLVNQRAIINLETFSLSIDGHSLKIIEEEDLNPYTLLINKSSCNTVQYLKTKISDQIINKNEMIGKMRIPPAKIRLHNPTPISSPSYSIPHKYKHQIKEEIERLLRMNLIRLSRSEFCSPAFPVVKRNGSIRLVVDYRKLNQQTIKLGYPFPTAFDQFVHLNKSTIFSKFDMNSGFYQIPLDEESIPLTSFSIGNSQYEFLRLPFGLVNALRIFQRCMNELLTDLNYVRVFMDDILVFSKSEIEHARHCQEVIKRIQDIGGTINREKSEIFKEEISYLGVLISKNGITPDDTKNSNLNNYFRQKIPNNSRRLLELLTGSAISYPDSQKK